ncbi:MAG TPA: hypothetical protein VN922_14550 [Bacteroidia bacterium]|nr:hypothetical protein [Bacteroidia bacterium]
MSGSLENPRPLRKIAFVQTIKKMLQDASKLSFRLGTDIHIYNSPGFREIRKTAYVNIINEKIKFLVTTDDRIAIDGIDSLSSIFPKDIAFRFFNILIQHYGLLARMDETGICYYEKDTLSYYSIKNKMITSEDPIKWTGRALIKGRYFNLWDD